MLTHFNMVANNSQFKRFDVKGMNWDHDAQLGVLPFFHIYVSLSFPFHSMIHD